MVCYCVWDGGGSGLHSSDVWKQLGMEHRPCTQEGGKEREGGSVELGKSEGGGGGRGGSSQWKNCEMCLAKSGAVSLVFFSSKNNGIQISCFYLKEVGLSSKKLARETAARCHVSRFQLHLDWKSCFIL